LEAAPVNRSYLPHWAVGLAVGLTGCQRERPAPPAPPPPAVTVARPVAYPVQTYYEYNGNLDAVETVQVTARVKGFLNEILFTEGDEVQQGDLLFRIDPREYAAAVKRADADRLKAATELKLARAEEDRLRKLRGAGAVSVEDFEQRVATRETAEAVVLQTEAALEAARLQLGYTEVRSPIAGQISRTLVTRGNLVGQNQDTVLTSIVSMDPLYVYFDAPERDLVEYQRSLRAGQQGEILSRSLPVEVGVATEAGYPHAGVIDFRENRVDAGTGTVRIRGRIPNPRVPPANARLLYPGLFARVRVPAGEPRPLPAIPEDALMTGQEGRYVYVLGEGDVVQKRTVTVGPHVWKAPPPADGQPPGWTLAAAAPAGPGPRSVPVPAVVAIESGLTPDDRVVVNGLTKARPGLPVAPEPWELRPPPAGAEPK
jgi:RND family efflux transporter MFP subunit